MSTILAAIALYSVIEYAYLSTSKNTYISMYQRLLKDPKHTVKWGVYALLAYAAIVLGMNELIFAYVPGATYGQSAMRGAIVGAVMYGLYNFTNKATLGDGWEECVLWQDTLYGTWVMATVALAYKWLLSTNF